MRTRKPGKLDALIRRATKNDQQGELASLLGVTRHAVYKWNRGDMPGSYWQMVINDLCRALRTRLVYPGGPCSVRRPRHRLPRKEKR